MQAAMASAAIVLSLVAVASAGSSQAFDVSSSVDQIVPGGMYQAVSASGFTCPVAQVLDFWEVDYQPNQMKCTVRGSAAILKDGNPVISKFAVTGSGGPAYVLGDLPVTLPSCNFEVEGTRFTVKVNSSNNIIVSVDPASAGIASATPEQIGSCQFVPSSGQQKPGGVNGFQMLFESYDRTFGPMRLQQESNGDISVQGTLITTVPEPQNSNVNSYLPFVDVTYKVPFWFAFEFSGYFQPLFSEGNTDYSFVPIATNVLYKSTDDNAIPVNRALYLDWGQNATWFGSLQPFGAMQPFLNRFPDSQFMVACAGDRVPCGLHALAAGVRSDSPVVASEIDDMFGGKRVLNGPQTDGRKRRRRNRRRRRQKKFVLPSFNYTDPPIPLP